MFIHLLAAVTASTLAATPVHAGGASRVAQPEAATYAGMASSRPVAAIASKAPAIGPTGHGCLADPHATVVFREGAPGLVVSTTDVHGRAEPVLGMGFAGIPMGVAAAPALTSDDCKAEFRAMYDALDSYMEASGIFGISWLGGAVPAAIAGVHLFFKARAVDKADARLDECLAK